MWYCCRKPTMFCFVFFIQLNTTYFYMRRWALLGTGTESVRRGHAVAWGGWARAWAGGEADSWERGHLKFSVQAAHLVWGCHLLTQEIQRSFQKQLWDLSSTLFKKSDTKWQLSLSAISLFFVHFTDMIIRESYWFWYQISHFDIHTGKVFMMLAKFLRFFYVSLTWDCNSLILCGFL